MAKILRHKGSREENVASQLTKTKLFREQVFYDILGCADRWTAHSGETRYNTFFYMFNYIYMIYQLNDIVEKNMWKGTKEESSFVTRS